MASKKRYITLFLGLVAFFSFFQTDGFSTDRIVRPVADTAGEKEIEAVEGKIAEVDPQKKIIRIEPRMSVKSGLRNISR